MEKVTSFREWMSSIDLLEEDLDFMWDFCVVFKHSTIESLDRSGVGWRDLRLELVQQIPGIYEKLMKEVNYYNG